MKRIKYFALAALIALFALLAVCCASSGGDARSNDTGFTLTKVNGVTATDGTVTLKSSEYAELAAADDITALCEYILAEKARVTAVLDDKTLTFTVTAESGVQKEYGITLTVLSNDATFDVSRIFDYPTADGGITVSEGFYGKLSEFDGRSIAEHCTAIVPDGAKLTGIYSAQREMFEFACVSEDGTKTTNKSYAVRVTVPFGSHTVTGFGSRDGVEWSSERRAYVLNGATAFKDENGGALAGSYAVCCSVALSDYRKDSEMCFTAYESGNSMIRFYIRAVDADHVSVRTDYRDRSDYKNEIMLTDDIEYSDGTFLNIELIVKGNSLVIRYGGKTLYRRTLAQLRRTEACIYPLDCTVLLRNIETETDPAEVATRYNAAMAEYRESDIGKTLIGAGENIERITETEDRITIENAKSGTRVMAGLYREGVPVGGYEYAVGGKLSITDPRTSGSAASKVEFQIYSSFANFVKFHLFRFPSNNSFYIYPTVNGKGTEELFGAKNNMMPTPANGIYEVEYVFVYDHGRIETYLKDGSALLSDYTLVYSMDTDWGYTGYAFANRQYCNTVFTQTQVYYGSDFDELTEELRKPAASIDLGTNVFESAPGGRYYKTTAEYASVKAVDECEYFVFSGTAELYDCSEWGQFEIKTGGAGGYVRYVFEYNKAHHGFQIFTERSSDGKNWRDYALILPAQPANAAYCNFAVVNESGKYSFLIDGYVWHTYENISPVASVSLGGKNCMIKLANLKADTDEQNVKEFAANMKIHEYVSPYENRIASLAEQYKNAQKGGILLMGSSSIDYWYTWQEDLGADTLGYNVGIGGTKVADWMYAYDRLVKPFAPSKIVLFLGGNDVNGGNSAASTVTGLSELLTRMHTDFPSAEIYYILSMPVPNNYADGKYTLEYGRLIDGMKDFGAATEWLTVIDLAPELIRDNNPVPEYFKPDNMHLTDEGYAVWTRVLRSYIFRNDDR